VTRRCSFKVARLSNPVLLLTDLMTDAELTVDSLDATGEIPVGHLTGQALSLHDDGVYALRLGANGLFEPVSIFPVHLP